jgi:hypothetical protein
MGEDLNLALALEGRVSARGEAAKLVAIADKLATLPDPEIDPKFAAALEARLLGDAAQPKLTVVRSIPETPADEIVRRADVIQMPRRRMVVRRSVVSGVVAASMAAFPLVAAASALPGSPFYGLKKGIERMELAFAGDSVHRGLDYAKFAQERTGELGQLVSMGADADLIAATANEARSDLGKAQDLVIGHTSDRGILARFSSMVRETETDMRAISGEMNAEARADVAGAIRTSQQIQQQVAAALGLPVSPIVLAGSSAPAATVTTGSGSAQDGNASSGNDGQSSDGTSVRKAAHGADDDPTGTGKALGGASDEGCDVPGSANGLGEVTAPVVRLLCN